jgi:hypothetical protein
MPNMVHAGVYSATLQYLKAVKGARTKEADAVAKKLTEQPVDDAFTAIRSCSRSCQARTAYSGCPLPLRCQRRVRLRRTCKTGQPSILRTNH